MSPDKTESYAAELTVAPWRGPGESRQLPTLPGEMSPRGPGSCSPLRPAEGTGADAALRLLPQLS